ncbi:MAG TPA: cobalt transporter CbiM [Bacillota bacterium]
MHIPDGYLSPQTCLVTGAAALPLTWRAMRAVRAGMASVQLPHISLGAAFAFVIQMINVPVPDGTTAHATGAPLLAVALGPWAAVLALTATLAIQALLFADGGILALGANVLNIAVLAPFSTYAVYWLLTRGQPSPRRQVWAAAAGAFVGIHVAAMATAIELGIQPLLFLAADGTPLYAPYPLSLAVPAMLYAHLLVAGPLEAAVTALAVAYLIRTGYPLYGTRIGRAGASTAQAGGYAVGVAGTGAEGEAVGGVPRWAWRGLGLLAVLTPLGLLASGTAWGEWGIEELEAQLGYVPRELARWVEWWSGLLPDYSVPALGDGGGAAVLGYWLSLALGVAVILVLFYAAARLLSRSQRSPQEE